MESQYGCWKRCQPHLNDVFLPCLAMLDSLVLVSDGSGNYAKAQERPTRCRRKMWRWMDCVGVECSACLNLNATFEYKHSKSQQARANRRFQNRDNFLAYLSTDCIIAVNTLYQPWTPRKQRGCQIVEDQRTSGASRYV